METRKKNIVFVCWKDINNPAAGGAEVVIHEFSKRMLSNKYSVTHLVPGFQGCRANDEVEGVKIIRLGNSIFYFYLIPFFFEESED